MPKSDAKSDAESDAENVTKSAMFPTFRDAGLILAFAVGFCCWLLLLAFGFSLFAFRF